METRVPVAYSPDGKYFSVYATRGNLATDEVTDEIRIYRTEDVERGLRAPSEHTRASPYWVIEGSNHEGPVITMCRWLANSQGIAFLERSSTGNRMLKLAQVADRRLRSLSPANDSVDEFDVLDAAHFVYRIPIPPDNPAAAESTAIVTDVSGKSLASLMVPDSVAAVRKFAGRTSTTAHLWAAMGGGASLVVSRGGAPLVVSSDINLKLALSPGGNEVATVVPVQEVPNDWEQRYPPPIRDFGYRIRAGKQDPEDFYGAKRYVRIHLRSGVVLPIAEGPIGSSAGWFANDEARWSADGRRLVLSSGYTGAIVDGKQRPCIAVVEGAPARSTCLLALRERANLNAFEEQGSFVPISVEFEDGDPHVVKAVIGDRTEAIKALEFRESPSGHWRTVVSKPSELSTSRGLRVWIDEDLNRAPRLMAGRGRKTVLLWDLNPGLEDVTLAKVMVYRWHDPSGREWIGGLYTPLDFESGKRHPLVIQTHGFIEHQFNPDGMYTTGSAAQVLASAGFAVLQVRDNALCGSLGAAEAQCAAAGYDAAVRQLTAEGYIDSGRVGLQGFSRTCLYVTQALAFGETRYQAATLTEGVMKSYTQYLTELDSGPWPRELDTMIGAPVGTGLVRWAEESPVFHLERTNAAVQITAEGKESLLFMWEPYARLRYSHKPVDAMLLNTSEHVLTNPQARLASQGGAVDWFQFWLAGQEDPVPGKRIRYRRWRELRDLRLSGLASPEPNSENEPTMH